MRKPTNPKELKFVDWCAAYDDMISRGIEPRIPKQGEPYNCFVSKIGPIGRDFLCRYLPTKEATIKFPRYKTMIGISVFDIDAVNEIFDFLKIKRSFAHKIDPKFLRIL